MPSNLIIGSSIENSGELPRLRAHYEDQWENFTGGRGGVSEIEEEPIDRAVDVDGREFIKIPLPTIREEAEGRPSAASFDFEERREDVVYVAVGNHGRDDQASMGALLWALKHEAVSPSSVVFLVHVFPETKYIPTPLGNLPISQVNTEQKELYLAQERGKRREFLNKFLSVCSDSKVKVDTILIESEMEAKAILDLIPILNIRRLVLGATRSTIRKMRSRKGNGVADQIRLGAPDYCEVNIIYDGREMTELTSDSTSSSPSLSPRAISDSSPRIGRWPSSPSPSPRASTVDSSPRFGRGQKQMEPDSTSCGCFKL